VEVWQGEIRLDTTRHFPAGPHTEPKTRIVLKATFKITIIQHPEMLKSDDISPIHKDIVTSQCSAYAAKISVNITVTVLEFL